MTEYKDLIVEIAKPLYAKNSIYDLEDLIQVGYIGVIKALQNFDEEKDSDIQKFMILSIKNEINRFISRFKDEFKKKRSNVDLDKLISKQIKEFNALNLQKLTTLEKSIIALKCEGYTRKEICDLKSLTKNEYYSIFLSAIGKIVNG